MTARAPGKTALTCQRAFQLIARRCLVLVRQHNAAACRGDPDAIHQMRIALTKLRAAQKFFAAMTRDKAWPQLRAGIRWVNSVLGAARDSDVTAAYAKTQRAGSFKPADSKLLAKEVAQTHRQLTLVLRSKRCDQLLTALAQWIDRGPWLKTSADQATGRRTQLLADFAPCRLQQWKRRLMRKSADGMDKGGRRHRLRIAVKRYRYMREALAAIGLPENRSGRRERGAAQSAQGTLGDLRDLQRFRKMQPQSLPAGRYRRQKERLLHKATRAFHRLG